MKKILFSDRYGLTQAVLEGRKTMTRRIIKAPRTMEGKDVYGFSVVRNPQTEEVVEVMALDADGGHINNILPKYKVGEVVAVAQNLKDMGYDGGDTEAIRGAIYHTPAWTNKMFVSASDCIHHIRITNVRVEQLQDISDQDCIKEGVFAEAIFDDNDYCTVLGIEASFTSPRKAFAALIDKVSGKGTWESNPYCFVYEFELYGIGE